MKIFSGSANPSLAQKIAEILTIPLSGVENHIFPDGERRIMLQDDVAGEDVIIVQPTSPPVDSNLVELCLLLDAARISGARQVTAVVPYVGYQRQDHIFRTGEARSLEVVIRIIEASGASAFVGVDFHSIKVPELFHIPVEHLSALPLFAKKIKELSDTYEDSCLVTPDLGGIRRIELLKDLVGDINYVCVQKDRDIVSGKIQVSNIEGDVKKTCFIVDDMISSGGTIVQAINALKKQGAERFFVMATHPVFSEKAPELLQNSLAEKIFVTDSIQVPEEKQFQKLEVLSLASLIAEILE